MKSMLITTVNISAPSLHVCELNKPNNRLLKSIQAARYKWKCNKRRGETAHCSHKTL